MSPQQKKKPIPLLKMAKVIIDTNVFLSAILFGGLPYKILEFWLQKRFILCISPELKGEIISKLTFKFSVPKEVVETISYLLDIYSEKYIPKKKITICKDPTDNFLLELAEESKADFLISGDKLVLEIKAYKQTRIVSPKEFLEKIDK